MESERSELAELNKMKEFEILNELKIESNTMTNPLDSRRRTCRRSIPVGLSFLVIITTSWLRVVRGRSLSVAY